MRKIILVVICSLLLGCFSNVVALSLTDKFKESFIATYHYVDSKGKYGDFQHFTRVSDGSIAYCIEPGVPPSKEVYEGLSSKSLEELASFVGLNESTLEKVSMIAYFGYGYNDHLSDEWIVATQSLIWQETGRIFSFTSRNNRQDPDLYKINTPKAIQSKMDEISNLVVNFMKKIDKIADVTLFKNEIYEYQNEILSNYRVKECINCEATIKDNVLSVKVKEEDGKVTLEKNYTSWNNDFIVYAHNLGQDFIVPGKGIKDEVSFNFKVLKGSLTLNKYDAETKLCENKLKGSIYKLYNAQNEEFIQDLVIDNNCQAKVTNLDKGRYYVLEYQAMEDYELDPQKYFFEITQDNLNVTINSYEKKYLGMVRIMKVDSETKECQGKGESNLKGAVYGIFDKEDHLIQSLSISNNCVAESKRNLKLGEYYILELISPMGYHKDLEKHYFTVTKENADGIIELKVEDKEYKTKLIIDKTYLINNDVLPEVGAVFGIYQEKSNKLLYTLTIDELGRASVTLPYGKYVLKQLKGKEGYEKTEDIFINVDENVKDETLITLLNKQVKIRLKINKVDELGQPIKIAGIKFKIYDLINQKYICQKTTYPSVLNICEYITTDKGEVILPDGLNVGRYRLEEVEGSLKGYIWNKEGLEFAITEDIDYEIDKDLGKYLELNFVNEKVRGQLEVYKLDKDTKIPLSGALIAIYKENGELYKEVFTDSLGKVFLDNLDYGRYYLVEKQAPTGYLVSMDKIFFEIVNNDLVQINIEDEIIKIPDTYLEDKNYGLIGSIFIGLGLLFREKKHS